MNPSLLEPPLHRRLRESYGSRNIEKEVIPPYIIENLNKELFPWQKEALQYFLTFYKNRSDSKPVHLMFNMATGSGKTLVMGATILYYYKRGYRRFIFFVNLKNIVDKTEKNFIDNFHYKYLFKNSIVIDNQTVPIRKVDNFSEYPVGIEIKFTTIQQLYNDIHIEKENQITEVSLKRHKIVMLADEAHHLNANTAKMNQLPIKDELKKNAGREEVEYKGWEQTVLRIKDNNPDNVLLEFTATIPEKQDVQAKYADKLITQFRLQDFLKMGYTKAISLVHSSLSKRERILLALTFHYCRHKVAQKHNIHHFKPVILFRSKRIEDSFDDHKEFLEMIANLQATDFDFLKRMGSIFGKDNKLIPYYMSRSRIEQILFFCLKNEADYQGLVIFLKNNFTPRNVMITNSQTNKSKQEKTSTEQNNLLNSLENRDNPVRAIFTVQRLTEGWDVLNLFDIVRLYEGQDAGKDKSGNRKAGSSTIAEKQLIGRGVRYYPFEYDDKLSNRRKFENDLENELRILEELYFHSDNESRYISELKKELKDDGYLPPDDKVRKTFAIKEQFRQTAFYEDTPIYINDTQDNPLKKSNTLAMLKKSWHFEHKIKDLELTEEVLEMDKEQDTETTKLKPVKYEIRSLRVKDIDKHIFRKAINMKARASDSVFRFNNCQTELAVNSIDDLQTDDFCGGLSMQVAFDVTKSFSELPRHKVLEMTLKLLDKISLEIKKKSVAKIGGEFRRSTLEEVFGKPKNKIIDSSKEDQSIPQNDWYVLDGFVGTDEEKEFINWLKIKMGKLERHHEVYLVRNEEVYKIFDFDNGMGFCPDFLLFLKRKSEILNYQIFIEPKGSQFKDSDDNFTQGKEGWKEKFMEQISHKYGVNKPIFYTETKKYVVVGLPFFNQKDKGKFEAGWHERLPNLLEGV